MDSQQRPTELTSGCGNISAGCRYPIHAVIRVREQNYTGSRAHSTAFPAIGAAKRNGTRRVEIKPTTLRHGSIQGGAPFTQMLESGRSGPLPSRTKTRDNQEPRPN